MTSDIGQAALDSLFNLMQIDEEWSVRYTRGYTWWAKDRAQRITATAPVEDDGCLLSTVTVETEVLDEVPVKAETNRVLAAMNAWTGALSALVMDAEAHTVKFVSTVTLHEQVKPWADRVLGAVATLQAADAQFAADAMADILGGRPAVSEHPTSGRRFDPDDMLNARGEIFIPGGTAPSRWKGDEMLTVHRFFQRASMMSLGSEDGVGAEFPYGDFSCLVQFRPNESHPSMGSGLLVTLDLPDSLDLETAALMAARLNQLEVATMPFSQFCGSWCVSPNGLVAFKAFYPNVLFAPNGGLNIAMYMARRADWVSWLRDGRSGEERWKAANPAVAWAMALGTNGPAS